MTRPIMPQAISYVNHLSDTHLTQLFETLVLQHDHRFMRKDHFVSRQWTVHEMAEMGLAIEADAQTNRGDIFVGRDNANTYIELSGFGPNIQGRVAGEDALKCEKWIARIRGALEEHAKPHDPRVPVWFWTYSEDGPKCIRRKIHVPTWSEIVQN